MSNLSKLRGECVKKGVKSCFSEEMGLSEFLLSRKSYF